MVRQAHGDARPDGLPLFSLDVGGFAQKGTADPSSAPLVERAREIYRRRRYRERFFCSQLFGEPVWDGLLDLYIARQERRDISVSSACIATSVPTTTALRHLGYMVDAGLVMRAPHPSDQRCSLIELTDEAVRLMSHYLAWELACDAATDGRLLSDPASPCRLRLG